MDNNTYFAVINAFNGITYLRIPGQCSVCKDFEQLVLFTFFFPLPMPLMCGIAVIVTLWTTEEILKMETQKLEMAGNFENIYSIVFNIFSSKTLSHSKIPHGTPHRTDQLRAALAEAEMRGLGSTSVPSHLTLHTADSSSPHPHRIPGYCTGMESRKQNLQILFSGNYLYPTLCALVQVA